MKGVLKITAGNFASQLTTLEVTNCQDPMKRISLTKEFGLFFSRKLFEIYGPISSRETLHDPHAPPRRKRRLALGTMSTFEIKTEDNIKLKLSRYQGGNIGPLLLLHGFGASANMWLPDTNKITIVESFVARGYDVWNLDWRCSFVLPTVNRQSTIDEVAHFDIPAAVAKILEETKSKDLMVFGHCIGSVTAMCSFMTGKLKGKIRCYIGTGSSLHPYPIWASQAKAEFKHLPTFMSSLGVLTESLVTDTDRPFHEYLFDKFATLNADAITKYNEHCSNAVCHRITFFFGQAFPHANISPRLHDNLHEFFGGVNLKMFNHLAKMFREHRCVPYEESEKTPEYWPKDEKKLTTMVKENLDFPILLLTGKENLVFTPKTMETTYNELVRLNPTQKGYDLVLVPGYGHMDILWGKKADKDIFPTFFNFLEKYGNGGVIVKDVTPTKSDEPDEPKEPKVKKPHPQVRPSTSFYQNSLLDEE